VPPPPEGGGGGGGNGGVEGPPPPVGGSILLLLIGIIGHVTGSPVGTPAKVTFSPPDLIKLKLFGFV
jgi:hypothetical protein